MIKELTFYKTLFRRELRKYPECTPLPLFLLKRAERKVPTRYVGIVKEPDRGEVRRKC